MSTMSGPISRVTEDHTVAEVRIIRISRWLVAFFFGLGLSAFFWWLAEAAFITKTDIGAFFLTTVIFTLLFEAVL